jgi:hypothetical protein
VVYSDGSSELMPGHPFGRCGMSKAHQMSQKQVKPRTTILVITSDDDGLGFLLYILLYIHMRYIKPILSK